MESSLIRKVRFKWLFLLVLLTLSSEVEATIQQGWSVSWSSLTTNEADNMYTGGQIYQGDGAEYKFQVTGYPGNAWFSWTVSPDGGIKSGTSSSTFTWQSPLASDGTGYAVTLRAGTTGEGVGGDTLKAKWTGNLKKSFVDVYFEDAGVESDQDAYLAATQSGQSADTIDVIGLVTKLNVTSAHTGASHDHSSFNPLGGMLLQWEELNKVGTPGALNSLASATTNATTGEVVKTFTADGSGGTGSVNYKAKLAVHPDAGGGEVDSEASEKIHVVKVELFRDSEYTQVLDDWPESGNDPRTPKYVFGDDDPVYVQVKGVGSDSSTQETITDCIKVTSESDTTGINLTVKETGVNTDIFRNSLPAGELLYVSTASSEGNGDKIKVVNEEVLTFAVKTNGTYLNCKDVMLDRAEEGVEWQSDYDTYDDTYGTIHTADDFAEGFYNNLGTANLVWFTNFDNGDLNSTESHFASSGDSSYADSVDIVIWCGHGIVDANGSYMRFFVDLQGGQKQPPDKLYWSEIDWGNDDVDWVILNTCNFLNGTDNQLKDMASGVHLICGYSTDMTVVAAAGQYFANKLESMSIKDAWHKQCWRYQPDGNTSRVFGSTASMNDTFPTDGPIETSRDPTASSNYSHSDYTTGQ